MPLRRIRQIYFIKSTWNTSVNALEKWETKGCLPVFLNSNNGRTWHADMLIAAHDFSVGETSMDCADNDDAYFVWNSIYTIDSLLTHEIPDLCARISSKGKVIVLPMILRDGSEFSIRYYYTFDYDSGDFSFMQRDMVHGKLNPCAVMVTGRIIQVE